MSTLECTVQFCLHVLCVQVELDWHAIQSRLEEDLQNEAHRK